MPLALTAIELKLLRLIMDGAAQPGEIANGAQMLIQSLRKRGVSAEEVETAFTHHGLSVPKYSRPDYGLIACPFKKHKNELARDIDPSYLRFMIDWIRAHQDPEVQKKFGGWAHQMESFLAQG